MKHYTTINTSNYYCTMAYNYVFDIVDELNDGWYEDSDLYEAVYEFIDNKMIYYSEQWDLLKEYFTPQDLTNDSLSEAITMLVDDICSMIDEEEVDEEDDEEEE